MVFTIWTIQKIDIHVIEEQVGFGNLAQGCLHVDGGHRRFNPEPVDWESAGTP